MEAEMLHSLIYTGDWSLCSIITSLLSVLKQVFYRPNTNHNHYRDLFALTRTFS